MIDGNKNLNQFYVLHLYANFRMLSLLQGEFSESNPSLKV